MNEIFFDHHSQDYVGSHRRIHRDLRASCPVAKSRAYGGFWVLTRYEDVFEVARNDDLYSSATSLLIPPQSGSRLIPLQCDPPELARFRSVLTPYLTPSAISWLEPELLSDCERAVSSIREAGAGEIVSSYAGQIPARTVMRLIGLSADEASKYAEPIHRSVFATPGTWVHEQALEQVAALDGLIEAEVRGRVARPSGDLISHLLASESNGIRTSEPEVVDMVRMLIFGGLDTVASAISNALAILAVRRDLRALLVDDLSQVPRAMEEFLRYEAPIQAFARVTTREVELDGCTFEAGDKIWLNWGAANHDPIIFENPDTLNLTRTPNRHLAFGVGGHRCLGSSLARLQMRVMMQTFLRAIPEFELAAGGIVEPASIGQILGKREVHLRIPAAD